MNVVKFAGMSPTLSRGLTTRFGRESLDVDIPAVYAATAHIRNNAKWRKAFKQRLSDAHGDYAVGWYDISKRRSMFVFTAHSTDGLGIYHVILDMKRRGLIDYGAYNILISDHAVQRYIERHAGPTGEFRASDIHRGLTGPLWAMICSQPNNVQLGEHWCLYTTEGMIILRCTEDDGRIIAVTYIDVASMSQPKYNQWYAARQDAANDELVFLPMEA